MGKGAQKNMTIVDVFCCDPPACQSNSALPIYVVLWHRIVVQGIQHLISNTGKPRITLLLLPGKQQ